MKRKLSSSTVLVVLVVNLVGTALMPSPALAASMDKPVFSTREALPAWFASRSDGSTVSSPSSVASLPDWFAAPDRSSSTFLRSPSSETSPAWFSADDGEQNSGDRAPLSGPAARPHATPINAQLLTVDVIPPEVASLGAPIGSGELYTAVVSNNSSHVAYGVYLTATHRAFMVYDGGSELISRTGTITLETPIETSATAITWTPAITTNLAPGEAITLNFRLRATCNAESGKRLEVGVRYNADPPPAEPIELNTGALNVTTGRGNLVVNKEPDLQSLGTGDFGRPITWTVEVQNTGLGQIYNATVTDTGGIDLAQPGGDLTPSVTIPELDVDEVVTYTVVGTVESCNFTNVAEGAWPCGNKVGDATTANPVSSTVSVLFTPDVPQVDLALASPVTFPYCAPVTRTVVVTVDNPGGPAGDFRLDSTLDGDSFLEILTSTITGDWSYDPASGIFAYTGGLVTGTLEAQSTVTLTFEVQPDGTVCNAGSGSLGFRPLYRDICSDAPFTGTFSSLSYAYAQDNAPALEMSKTGPRSVTSGETFTYAVTLSGLNPQSISGTIYVTDVLPAEFELQGVVATTTGTTSTDGQTVTWQIDSGTYADGASFNETLIYEVQAITTTGGLCGAGLQVDNQAVAFARTTCDACADFNPTAEVDTIIENEEGIFASDTLFGSREVCDEQGFTIVNSYEVTGSVVVTWANAAFTEALGTDIGGAGYLTSAIPLLYRDAFSLTVNGTDYSDTVTPTVVTPDGHLYVDLGPLDAAGAPTQSFTMQIAYTVGVSETSLGGDISRTFYDWSQLYLPNSQSSDVCAGNDAFNQAIELTIGRGDLSVGLAPRALNRCETNRAIINVNDNAPGRLTDHVVITFTSSIAEIETARNFSYTGSLAGISPIAVTSDTLGGGRAIITFTLPATEDLEGDGQIQFDLDVGCTDEAPWRSAITFQTQCDFTRDHQASLSHAYHKPNLILFVTPVEYTLRQRDALWKFFVTNNGSLTATNVLVTNTIQGLSVYTYTADSPGVTIPSLPVANGDAVFTIDEIGPGQQRAVTVTAEAIQCEPLGVDITAALACLGEPCGERTGQVNFNKPRPYLLTNNGQTADLPMCDVGRVIFTTKNASRDTTLYQLNITETLEQLAPAPGEPITVTVIDRDGTALATTNAFTPEIVIEPVGATAPSTTTLIWRAISATNTAVYTWFQGLPPLHLVRITVPVQTSCVPPTPQAFAAAEAEEPCGRKLGYTEDAVTLQTMEPTMSLEKQGRVIGGSLGETVYAAPGQTVTWQLEADNLNTEDAYLAHNVILTDTWPEFFEFVTATTDYSPTIDTEARIITWTIGDVEPVDNALFFFITGTVSITDGACTAATTNTARLLYGCDDGCSGGAVPLNTAGLESYPDLEVILAPEPIPICAGDIRMTVRNHGAAAYSNTLTVTIPSPGYLYSQVVSSDLTITEIITGDGTAPQFKWDRIPGRTTADPYEFDLVLRLRNSADTGDCPSADAQTVTATMEYDDHSSCVDTAFRYVTATDTLDVLVPALEAAKTPRTQVGDYGETITWTVAVTNTGDGQAENVVVNDRVSNNFVDVTATVGSDGTSPTVVGNAITWTLGSPLAASGGQWSAQVSAVFTDTGANRNVVTATAYCATGCETATASDTAYSTLLRRFEKGPAVQTGTIGSLAVFTLDVSLTDKDTLYEDLILTDTLPLGLGYVDSVLTYTVDGDGSLGGPTEAVSTTPTITPSGTYTSGDLVWRLGDLPGTVTVDGVITAVIQDVDTTYEGVRLTNALTMAYTDDGQPYVYTDTADVDVLEPILHLGKTYVTPRGCAATLLEENFSISDTSTSPFGDWLEFNDETAVRDGMLHLSDSGDVGNDEELSDFSMSFMARKNIESSHNQAGLWIVFREVNPGDDWDESYHLRWNDVNAGNSLVLEQLGGIGAGVLDTAVAPSTGEWHHFEIRARGFQFQVFVDGERVISAADVNGNYASGYTHIRTAYDGNDYDVDDILITRFGQTGCLVGANDPVTYTLTVSNQGRFNGHDLVVVDAIPDGMSLLTYTFTSDDVDTVTTTQPAPIPGATGVLTWGFNQLVPTDPFTPLDHTAITMTVVLTVSDGITANSVLPNQAALTYDAWITDTEPIPEIVRGYSGGSHSTAVRTVNGGIAKTVAFSPPPTATLGSLVTYTLIVPTSPISATLYDVVVTDTIDSRLYIESIDTAPSGAGVSSDFDRAAGWVTATFESIPHSTQAFITVTSRISHEWPSPAGDANAGETITNSAVMTHATAEEITRTNIVSTEVGEPDVRVLKSVEPGSGLLDGMDLLTYTLRLENTGSSPAHSLHITDAVPAGISVTAQYGGDARSGPVVGAGTLTWTVDYLSNTSPASVALLTYTARISRALSDETLLNTVDVRSHSLTETIPGVRPYTDTDSASVDTAPPSVAKSTAPITLRVGDITTYTLVFTVPAGTVGMGGTTSYLRDTLPAGVWAITDSETLSWTPAAVGPITFTDRTFGTAGDSQTVRWTFADAITSLLDRPTIITLTFQAQATGRDAFGGTEWPQIAEPHTIVNTVGLWQRGDEIGQDTAENEVIQPDLSILKTATPPDDSIVARGQTITYTLTLANAGHAPAYDLVVTDTLPVGVDYVRVISAPNPTDATVTETRAGQALTYTVSELAAGPGATMAFTVVGLVTETIGANLVLTNTAAIPFYDSQPGDGPGPRAPDEREYVDGEDDVVHRTIDAGITKAVMPPYATLGDWITYTIRVPEPLITATLYAVTVTDQLDARLQLHDVITDGVAGDVIATDNAFTVTYASIVSLTQRLITVTAVLSSPLGADAGEVITNAAILRHRDGGPIPSQEPPFTVTEPALDIDKASDPPDRSIVTAGDPVTYTVRLTNTLGVTVSAAYDLIITDTLPQGVREATPSVIGLAIDGVDVAGYSQSYADPELVVTLPVAEGIPPGGVLVLSYTTFVDSDVEASLDLINRARATWSSRADDVAGDRDYPPIEDTTTLTTPQAIGLTKYVVPPMVTVGSQVVFTVVVPDPTLGATLRDVVITDVIDGRLRIDAVSPATATVAGQTMIVSYTNIPSNSQRTVAITTTVRDLSSVVAGEQITNQVTFDYATSDGPIDSNVVTTTAAEPDVGLSKTVAMERDPVGASDLVTYALTLVNTGTWPAYDLVITDGLPTGVSYVGTQAITVTDPATATTGGAYPAWTVSQLNVGGSIRITFTARVAADIGAGQTLTNAAWGAYDGQPGDEPDERSYDIPTDTVPIETGQPALDLTKRSAPELVQPGGRLTYTLIVTNTGIVSATGVAITDTIPGDTSFVTATMPHAGPNPDPAAGSVITWSLGTLDIGEAERVTLVVSLDQPLPDGTIITNTGWLTSNESITDTDEVTNVVESGHTLVLVKTDAPDPVQAGGLLTYTLAWSVSGDEAALGLTISDTVPDDTTYQSCDGGITCGESGGVVVWALGDRTPGAGGAVTFTVAVTQPLADGTLIENAAIITDTQGVTQTDEVTTEVDSDHTLDVAKSVTPSVVVPNGLITYTIAYTVSGNEPAYSVTLSDTVPAHTGFESCSGAPCNESAGRVTWALGDFLTPTSGITQQVGSVTLVVRADAPLTDGLAIVNTVLITDTDTPTDTDTATTTVESSHDITLTKAVEPAVATPGELLTYTLAYTITGDESAPDVTISDTVPAHTTFWSAQPAASDAPAQGGAGSVVWRIGTVDPPLAGAVTLVVRVDAPLDSGTEIRNTATITDRQPLTDTDVVTTPVASSHALSVAKQSALESVVAGELLTYTVNWAVTGDEPAYDVTLSDTLPAQAGYVSCSGAPCNESGGLVTWALGDISPPDAGSVSLVVRVATDTPTGTLVLNAVTITDTAGLTDTDAVTTPVENVVDLAVTKVDEPDPVIVGTALVYTLTVFNNGPDAATNVVVTDTLPTAAVDFVDATPSYTYADPEVVWSLGALAAGETRLLTVAVTVRRSATEPFTNVVQVDTDMPDQNPDNNEDDEPTTPLAPGLQVIKSVDPGDAVARMPFTYTVEIVNTGQVTFDPLVVTDTLPPNFNYVTGSGDPADPSLIAEPQLVWDALGTLAPGERLTLSFAVTVTPGITGTYVNVVTAVGTTPGGVVTDTDDAPVGISDPAVVLNKHVVAIDRDQVAPNYITFTVEITNVGVSIIDELPLVDVYDPYYLSFHDATPYPDEDADDGQLVWDDLTGPTPNGFDRNLPPGETFVVTTVFRVAHDIDITTTNVATVTDVSDVFENPANDDQDDEDVGGDDEPGIPTPLTVVEFRAVPDGDAVRLEWATAAELGTDGFALWRATSEDFSAAERVATIDATGSDSRYAYADRDAEAGQRYWYWLVELGGMADGETYGPMSAGLDVDDRPYKLYLPLIQRGWGEQHSEGMTPRPAVGEPTAGRWAGLWRWLSRWWS